MGKKLEDNGFWESSRIILPEHKKGILRQQEALNYQTKPFIHEDELEKINQNLRFSLNYTEEVAIEIFGQNDNRIIEGIVTAESSYGKKIKIEFENGYEWIDFDEIISVKLNSSEYDYDTAY